MTSTRRCGDDFSTLKIYFFGVFTGCELSQGKTAIVIEKINFQIFVYEKSTQRRENLKVWRNIQPPPRRVKNLTNFHSFLSCLLNRKIKTNKAHENAGISLGDYSAVESSLATFTHIVGLSMAMTSARELNVNQKRNENRKQLPANQFHLRVKSEAA